jgi:hypothetical protein
MPRKSSFSVISRKGKTNNRNSRKRAQRTQRKRLLKSRRKSAANCVTRVQYRNSGAWPLTWPCPFQFSSGIPKVSDSTLCVLCDLLRLSCLLCLPFAALREIFLCGGCHSANYTSQELRVWSNCDSLRSKMDWKRRRTSSVISPLSRSSISLARCCFTIANSSETTLPKNWV